MSKESSFTEAIRQALAEEMESDSTVFLLGEDIAAYGGAFGVTKGLLERFGAERVVNTPISEGGFIGMSVGAAMTGLRPVAEIMFMDFIALASDQLINQAAKLHYIFGEQARCPMVIRTPGGAGKRYGPTHSQSLEAWFMHVPGLKIVAPSTPADAKGLLKSAIRDDNPVLFLESKGLYNIRGPVPEQDDSAVPLGKARQVCEGEDLTIIAWSRMAYEAEAAVRELRKSGVTAELLDLRTLNPMDMHAITDSACKTGRVLIVDEATGTCGISAEIMARLFEQAFDYLDAPVRRLTGCAAPVCASPPLEDAALPDHQKIIDAAIDLVEWGL